jgi:hypothetical protein
MMDGVSILPWEGADYRKHGFRGKRVLILGESGYDWPGRPVPLQDVTTYCIQEQLKEHPDDPDRPQFTKAFFTKLAIAFLNRPPTLADKRSFWDSVAFYNYYSEALLTGPGIAPPSWTAGALPFETVLEHLRPQRIIVLGTRLWRNHRGDTDEIGPTIAGAKQTETYWYSIRGGAERALAYGIQHPSSRAFDGRAWFPHIVRAIEYSEHA